VPPAFVRPYNTDCAWVYNGVGGSTDESVVVVCGLYIQVIVSPWFGGGRWGNKGVYT